MLFIHCIKLYNLGIINLDLFYLAHTSSIHPTCRCLVSPSITQVETHTSYTSPPTLVQCFEVDLDLDPVVPPVGRSGPLFQERPVPFSERTRLETFGSLPCLVTVPICSCSLLEACSSSSLAGLLERVVRAARRSFASGLYILGMWLGEMVCFKERRNVVYLCMHVVCITFLGMDCCMIRQWLSV